MKLVDEIVELASDGKQPLADVLRKCLVLAFELKNRKLKKWVEGELNGYRKDDELPEYRIARLPSVGNFSGPMGAWMPQRPLPLMTLSPEHREILDRSTRFNGPIAVYEVRDHSDGSRA